jgi:hypothetical protein
MNISAAAASKAQPTLVRTATPATAHAPAAIRWMPMRAGYTL